MGLPHITSFCWCMGLESGAKVVGGLHLLASASLLIVTSLMAVDAGSYVGTVEDAEDHLYSIWYKIAVGAAVLTVVHVLLALALLYAVQKTIEPCLACAGISMGAAVLTVVHVLLALALLLYAVQKRHLTILRAYVYIMCILYLCALLYIIITAALRGVAGSGSDIFLALVEVVLVFGFLAYCILCVHSYYLMLRSAEDMAGPNKPY